jgi:hypothetical protein
MGVLSPYITILIPVGIAIVAAMALALFSGWTPFKGICSKCGENLPHRGFNKCPWCGRICLVLWYR